MQAINNMRIAATPPRGSRITAPMPAHRARRHSADAVLDMRARNNVSVSFKRLPLTQDNVAGLAKQLSSTPSSAPAALSPIKRKRRPSLDESVSTATASSTSTASTTSTETARAFILKEVERLHDGFAKKAAADGGSTAVVAGKPRSFREVLVLQYPRYSAEKIDALAAHTLSRAAALKAAANRRAHAQKLAWSDEERNYLRGLFDMVDADRSGAIDMEEFVAAFMSGGKLSRHELEQTWRAHVLQQPNDEMAAEDTELDFRSFMSLLDSGEEVLFDHARNVLTGLIQASAKVRAHLAATSTLPELPSKRDSLLILDDGKQQLWRLCPGGKALMRTVLSQDHLSRRPSLACRPPQLCF